MADVFETVADLLERQQWVACAEQAALALAGGEWPPAKQAFLFMARSTSLRRLQFFTEALDPARLAVYLAEAVQDRDLLGRTLGNLAFIQYRIQGMERAAVETQRRLLDHLQLGQPAQRERLEAMLNLGVYLRAAGQHPEALAQFKATRDAATRCGNRHIAELGRTAAVWEALRLHLIDEAEPLIRAGDQVNEPDPRWQAGHLLDMAQLAMLRKNPAEAAGFVIAAMPFIEQTLADAPHLLPAGLVILADASVQCNDPELGLRCALIAKEKAEGCDRYDLMADAVSLSRTISLRHPDVVARVIDSMEGIIR